jgi:hypothetical protein
MPEKHYEGDWAKSKSRDLLGDMMDTTLLKYLKPSALSCLILPGIDAAEVFQIFKPRSIPMRNITGFEEKHDVADRIETKNLGIILRRQSVEDYFSNEHKFAYDVISLDYTGTLTTNTIHTLMDIRDKQTRNSFVLHIVNLIKRDSRSLPLYYLGRSMNADSDCVFDTAQKPLRWLEDRFEDVRKNSQEMEDKIRAHDSLVSEKKAGYSSLVKTALSGGTQKSLTKAFRFSAGDEFSEIKTLLQNELSNSLEREVILDDERLLADIPFELWPQLQASLDQMCVTLLKLDCERHGLIRDLHLGNPEVVAFALYKAVNDASKTTRFFLPKKSVCYSYISESGAPMVGDIHYFVYPRYEHEIACEIAHEIGFPDAFRIRDSAKLRRLLIDFSKACRKFLSNEEIETLAYSKTNRIFLGNSSKPVLTKKKAIEEFEQGTSVEDVKNKYRGWTSKPLAQWMAHVTMGTYSSRQLVQSSEDNDLEKISKGEAIDLLSSGIPTEEVYSAYPTSFSRGQLRAFKMNITKGLYSNGNPKTRIGLAL